MKGLHRLRKIRPGDWALIGAAACILALLVWLVLTVAAIISYSHGLDQRLNNAQARQHQLAESANSNAQAAHSLARQVRRLGGHPVVQPSELPTPIPGPPGAQGPQGERGPAGPAPSAAQIADAVAAYCSGGRCSGPAGKSVTPQQVANAVATYCNARGQCAGPTGASGATGATGPQGPPPSDAQVAQAVANYCSDGRCRGPQGPQGAQGPKGDQGPQGDRGPAGADGRGITTITCDGPPMTFTVTYSDGTSDTFTCGTVAPTAEPTPQPTP